MNIGLAIQKAKQILDEERSSPTVSYALAPKPAGTDPVSAAATLLPLVALPVMRSRRPREVLTDPATFGFSSVNCDLLRALMSQVAERGRGQFLSYVCQRLSWDVGCRKQHPSAFPSWDNMVSELPLVVEFLVRYGGKEDFFRFLETKNLAMIPGHVLMLMQLEDMIALNYTVFIESEYPRLASAVRCFWSSMKTFADGSARRGPGNTIVYGRVRYGELGEINLLRWYNEVTAICNGITEECRKARYLFLKGSLLEGLNLEVNQDRNKVESYLRKFGFSALLVSSLDEADRLYRSDATTLEFKSCIGHLRSFLENLQKEAMPRIHGRFGGTLPTSWGGGLAYLLQNSVLSKTEEQFAAAFYTLISDEGVHPLIAEKEYARLARNMVIEYALLFLTKLDRLGLASLKAASA